MAITDTAPYAPSAGVIKVLETYRETGLGGAPITTDLVMRLSMGNEVARRVVMSLHQLELLDAENMPTQTLVAFKHAPTDEYKQVFAAHLLDVYASVFAIVGTNLNQKTQTEIEDAFRHFKPDSLRKRMTTCFIGLCEYAGLISPATGRPGPKIGARPAKQKGQTTTGRASAPPSTPPPLPPLGQPVAIPGDMTTVQLLSGGTVILAVDVNLIRLSPKDREFVLDLIDKVNSYAEHPALPVSTGESLEVYTP
jgi:hypothetical protein